MIDRSTKVRPKGWVKKYKNRKNVLEFFKRRSDTPENSGLDQQFEISRLPSIIVLYTQYIILRTMYIVYIVRHIPGMYRIL